MSDCKAFPVFTALAEEESSVETDSSFQKKESEVLLFFFFLKGLEPSNVEMGQLHSSHVNRMGTADSQETGPRMLIKCNFQKVKKQHSHTDIK